MTRKAKLHSARQHTLRAVAAALLVAFALMDPAGPAGADEWGDAHYSASLVNEARDWEGSARVRWDGHLHNVAAAWANELANGGYLAHNPRLGDQVGGWRAENVGYGTSIAQVHWALWDSWSHWENMVNRGFDRIGVGVAYGWDGWVYIVQVFGG